MWTNDHTSISNYQQIKSYQVLLKLTNVNTAQFLEMRILHQIAIRLINL